MFPFLSVSKVEFSLGQFSSGNFSFGIAYTIGIVKKLLTTPVVALKRKHSA